jgi:hypothetical protein
MALNPCVERLLLVEKFVFSSLVRRAKLLILANNCFALCGVRVLGVVEKIVREPVVNDVLRHDSCDKGTSHVLVSNK